VSYPALDEMARDHPDDAAAGGERTILVGDVSRVRLANQAEARV